MRSMLSIKSTVCAVIFGGLTIACVARAQADDNTAAPANIAAPANVAMCQGCHGIARYRTAYPEVYPVPKLGGQQAAYIVKALQDYKQGLRTHPTMRSIAATLTDTQVAAIAAYYADTRK